MGRSALAPLVALALALLAGCRGPGAERFIPSEEKARAALETALQAWQHGEPHGAVAGTSAPVLQFVDSHHRPGQRLKSFAVLTLVPGGGPRVFVTRLNLDGPAEEVKVRYVVVGIDPLWVMRQEDYDMLAHWDHPMDATKPERPRAEP